MGSSWPKYFDSVFIYFNYNNRMINLIRCILLFTISYCFLYHKLHYFLFVFLVGQLREKERERGWAVVDHLRWLQPLRLGWLDPKEKLNIKKKFKFNNFSLQIYFSLLLQVLKDIIFF